MLEAGNEWFYKVENGVRHFYDIPSKTYKPIPGGDAFIILDDIRTSNVIWSNAGSTIFDLGDDVIGVEFHTKMNTLGGEVVEGIDKDVERNIQLEKERNERKMERKRLAAFRGEAYEESDDENDDGCGGIGGDEDDHASFSLPHGHQTKTMRTAAAFNPNVISTSSEEEDDILERSNVETLFDHVDDPSLSPQERVKRYLAKNVIHVSMEDRKKWMQEQKDSWKEKLPDEEFNGLWKDAEGYAFDVWNASQRDGFPKSKAELESIRRERRLKEIEKEQQAAIVLVDHREKIADQVLEDQGIKLSKGRKRSRMSFDRRSYDQGIEDSKEIDINQRAIRDEVKIKKEAKRPRR